MNGMRTGTGKHVFSYIAILACFLLSSCAFFERQPANTVNSIPPTDWARVHAARGQKLLAQRNYEDALLEWQTALSMSDGKPPADESLLYIGQIYCDPQNPKKDFTKSVASFQRLAREYPQSPWADTARIWMQQLMEQEKLRKGMSESLQENERLKKQWNETVQENEKLKRLSNESLQENARLKKIVEQSKTVDVEIDEKKRNQAK